MNELLTAATYPRVQAASGSVLLERLYETCEAEALHALTTALMRPKARALAKALTVPLAEAKATAAGPLKAVEAARSALAAERSTVADRLAAFFSSPRRKDEDDREHAPSDTTPKLHYAQQALAEAEAVARPFVERVLYHESQIEALRSVPPPDPAILEILGLGVNSPCRPKPPQEGGAS